MRTQVILTLAVLLAVPAASQEAGTHPTHAECSFSDGSRITVTHSLDPRSYRFVTDGNLVTVKGARVPAGDYSLAPAKGSDNNWTLTMKKNILAKGLWVVLQLRPLSTTIPVPESGFPVFFDHTGGSCTMHWRENKSDTVLSLEFTKENADLPVLN
jgi:hypothetical protein